LASELLPEFFALLGIDLFLMLSLLTCLLDDRMPKALPYIYQLAALTGYGHLLISKNFLTIFGDYMRFWYCFVYLLVCLANIVAVNIYFAAVKKQWTLAKVWSGAVSFPTIFISIFFLSNYGYLHGISLSMFLQIALVVSAIIMGTSVAMFLSPEALRNIFKREKEVRK
jgi:ABC-type tungstate transport system substrate-binding protein